MSSCDNVYHQDVIRTINHESSFALAMALNERADERKGCPSCGEPLFYYPVASMEEVLHYE
ncbi:hypothetical protein FPZ49_10275 [Paenibacillus cremeus]|uniref:Uncharacterized protein n=2 Tax=Paenibacillus cremeus TaxID=2163881 RepID=A0A559KDB9_9BACL|nr:hypothetical protein FPZ49_10275 [Paenibacillus cremeus]